MKQHHSIFPPAASLACALILMLAACTSDALDELPPAGTDPDARPLTITVSDGGMYATGQTRAQERGYSTVFTEGDRIGLYVVKDGTLEVENLCLTLQGGKWTLPAGASRASVSSLPPSRSAAMTRNPSPASRRTVVHSGAGVPPALTTRARRRRSRNTVIAKAKMPSAMPPNAAVGSVWKALL